MTALVYLAIIALWAIFLIPWLGRHRDEQSGRRSGERYNTAMRELRTRHSEHHDNAEAESGQDRFEDQELVESASTSHVREWLFSRLTSGSQSPHAASKAGRAAKRRRTVLAGITAGLLGSLAAAAAGAVPPVAVAPFAVLLVTYLAALAVLSRRSRSAAGGSASDAEGHREAARLAHLQAENMMGSRPSAQQPRISEWDAQPTHIPAYVSKPKASKVPRVMDLTRTDETWTGQDMVARAQEMQRQARLAQEQFEREIAVVEPDPVAEVARMANPADAEPYRRAANG